MASKMDFKHMIGKHFLAAIVALGLGCACWSIDYAQQPAAVPAAMTLPFVSPIFGDNMVLQRN
jgi:hypothetical protein